MLKNKTRILGLVIVMLCALLLIGCGKSDSRKLWDSYTKAIKNQDFEALAKTFYEPNSADLTNFKDNHSDYFSNVQSVKTKKYNETVNCDFSNSVNEQAYYKAEITAEVNGSSTYEITIYSYKNNNGTFFCSYFELVDGFEENEPNQYWTDKVYYETSDYIYKTTNTGTVYVEQKGNKKEVEVPATIDDEPVTNIGEYAFYKYNKILCFTVPTSKLRSLTIAEGVENISKYAFYQCKKLDNLVIPASMTYIDRMAFASCTGLKTLEINTRTEESGSSLELESTPSSTKDGEELIIHDAYDMQTGEIIRLSAQLGTNNVPLVEWSVSSADVLTVDASTGKVVALKPGEVTVTATYTKNRAIFAKVKITVTETPVSLKMYWDSFSRCNKLETIYIRAYNPNSIGIDGGSEWVFNSTCKIYVPKGTKDMYDNSILWSKYADQIFELDEDDAESNVNLALEKVNASSDSNVYYVTNPEKIDNIIYLINHDNKLDVVNVYTGSIILNNAEATLYDASTFDNESLYDLFAKLVDSLSVNINETDLITLNIQNEINRSLAQLDKIYEDYNEADYSEANYAQLQTIKQSAINDIQAVTDESKLANIVIKAWQDSYAILKNGEESKAEKSFDLATLEVNYTDLAEIITLAELKNFVFNAVKEQYGLSNVDDVTVAGFETVENDEHPGLAIYKVEYSATDNNSTDGAKVEESKLVYFETTYSEITVENTNLFDLLKVVLASATKYEK